jgi:RHS repeat-associated protein
VGRTEFYSRLIIFLFFFASSGAWAAGKGKDSPSLNLKDYNVAFGAVAIGEPKQITQNVTWHCNYPQGCISTHSTTLSGSSEFSIISTNCNGYWEMLGNTQRDCSMTLQYKPLTAGSKTATVKTGHTCPDALGCIIVNLTGTGNQLQPPPPPNSSGSPVGPPTPYVANPSCKKGSIIGVASMTLAEAIPIVGAAFKLYYSTDKVPGHSEAFKIRIPAFGAITNGYTRQIQATSTVAGINASQTFGPTQTNSVMEINNWTGAGTTTPVDLTITTTDSKTGASTITRTTHASVGQYDARRFGLGGLMPDSFAVYDIVGRRVFWGNGKVESTLLTLVNNQYVQNDYKQNLIYRFDSSTGYLVDAIDIFKRQLIYKWETDTNGKLTSYQTPTSVGSPNDVTSIVRSGSTITITTPYNKVTTLTLNSSGWVTNTAGPGNQNYSLNYLNSDGLLSSFTKPGNLTSNFTYGPTGLLTTDTDPNGISTTLTKTPLANGGWYVNATAPSGAVESHITSTADGVESSLVTIKGNTYLSTTEAGGLITRERDIYGHYISTALGSDPLGGRVAFYTNDTFGSNPVGTAYNDREFWKSVTPAGSGPSGTWNTLTTTIKLPKILATATETYDRVANNLTYTSPLGYQTIRRFLDYGKIWKVEEGPLLPRVNEYNSKGQLTKISQGQRFTRFDYDISTGLLEKISNPANQQVLFGYDAAGRVTSKVDPSNFLTLYTYTPAGKLASIKPAGRPVHNFNYNLSELMTSYVPAPLANSSGNISFTYDLDGRMATKSTPGGTLTYNYSPTSKLTSVQGATYGRQFTQWDGDFLVDSQTTDNVHTKQEHWGHLLTKETTTSAGVVDRGFKITYNPMLLPGNVTVQKANADFHTINYLYDKELRPVYIGGASIGYNSTIDRPSYVTQGSYRVDQIYNENDIDPAKRYGDLVGKQGSKNGVVDYTIQFNRNEFGRLSEYWIDTSGSPTTYSNFTYDTSGRLRTVVRDGATYTYNYDQNGNRTSKITPTGTINATYDDQDRLLTYGTFVYTYNSEGQRISKTDTSVTPNAVTTYTWDEFGQLRSVTMPFGYVLSYEYDVLGRRVSSKVNGMPWTSYLWLDSTRLLAEFNSSGVMTARYVYGINGQTPDYITSETGGTVRVITDHVGSPRRYVSTDGGDIDIKTDYDEFGVRLNYKYGNIGFAGGLEDAISGLVLFGKRNYDPEIGRFISRDPTLFAGKDTNLYSYAINDPVNFLDSNGMSFRGAVDAFGNMALWGLGAGLAVGTTASLAVMAVEGAGTPVSYLAAAAAGIYFDGAVGLALVAKMYGVQMVREWNEGVRDLKNPFINENVKEFFTGKPAGRVTMSPCP